MNLNNTNKAVLISILLAVGMITLGLFYPSESAFLLIRCWPAILIVIGIFQTLIQDLKIGLRLFCF